MGKGLRRLKVVSLGLILGLFFSLQTQGFQQRQITDGTTTYIQAVVPEAAVIQQGTIQWSPSNAPNIPIGFNALAVDPINSAILYAASNSGGVLKSTDSGANWAPINTGFSNISGSLPTLKNIVIDPVNSSTLYAATRFEGIFKSTNSGVNWVVSNNGLISQPGNFLPMINSLAIDPKSPINLYVATFSDGIFKSTDGGATWAKSNNGLTSMVGGLPDIEILTVDPVTPATLYAGSQFDGIFKSTDGGISWVIINTGLPANTGAMPFVAALVVDPKTPATLYAGTNAGLFKSLDGGGNWSVSDNGLVSSFAGGLVFRLVIDPVTPSTLYASIPNDGLFKSTDGGSSWAAINNGLTHTFGGGHFIVDLAINPKNPAIVYASTIDNGLFLSTNKGVTWDASNPVLLVEPAIIHTMSFDPKTPSTLYVTAHSDTFLYGKDGLFKSTDSGVTWFPSGTGLIDLFGFLPRVNSLAIDHVASAVVYAATDYGIFKSTNGGTTWAASHIGLVSASGFVLPINDLVIDPVNPSTLYAGTGSNGVFKSADGGATWTARNTGLTNAHSIVVDRINSLLLYVATTNDGVFKSTDGGINWSASNTGLPINVNGSLPFITSLIIGSSTNSSTLYAGTTLGNVFKSTNGGASWEGLSNSGVSSLAIDPSNLATVYAGVGLSGVLKTTDGGTNWIAENAGLNNGFAGFPFIKSLFVDPVNPFILYAVTDNGLFKGIEQAPSGAVVIESAQPFSNSTAVTLTLSCLDNVACTQMEFSNDKSTWSTPQAFSSTASWTLAVGSDGLRTVYVRFSDVEGNVSSVSSDAITLDTTPPTTPVILLPLNSVLINNTAHPTLEGSAAAGDTVVIRDGNAVSGSISTDANGTWFLSGIGATLSEGAHSFTATVTDAAGNSTVSAAVIYTVDITAPVISTPTNIIVEATSANGTLDTATAIAAFLSAATTTDAVDGVGIANHNAPTILPLGTTTVTFSAIDTAGNATTFTATITVQDASVPVFSTVNDITVEASASNTSVTLTAPTATDLFAVIITNNSPASYPLGITTVTWMARDANGNSAVVLQQVIVQDTTAPVIALSVSGNLTITKGDAFTVPNVTVSDAADSGVTVTATGKVKANTPGTYIITFTAVDASGNAATPVSLTVKVEDTPDAGAMNLWGLLLLGLFIIRTRWNKSYRW